MLGAEVDGNQLGIADGAWEKSLISNVVPSPDSLSDHCASSNEGMMEARTSISNRPDRPVSILHDVKFRSTVTSPVLPEMGVISVKMFLGTPSGIASRLANRKSVLRKAKVRAVLKL